MLPRDKWRKSMQWFGLMRPHAEVVAAKNSTLWHYMLEKCPMDDKDGKMKLCKLDEHFAAIALAMAGKEQETDCVGQLHYVHWAEDGAATQLWHCFAIIIW